MTTTTFRTAPLANEQIDNGERRVYWVSDDDQATLDMGPATRTDDEVWAELREQGHDGTGRLVRE